MTATRRAEDGQGSRAGLGRAWSAAALGFVATSLLLAPGCATNGGGAATRSPIDAIHLLTIPVAVNFDGAPGADGFAIKVYGSRANEPKPVPIPRGVIEILMFDGVVRSAELAELRPLRTWAFEGPVLRDRQYRTSIGVGYQFALAWGDAQPSQERITVLVRYRAPDGRVIPSLPSSISVNVQ
jgi:hypothetical protein